MQLSILEINIIFWSICGLIAIILLIHHMHTRNQKLKQHQTLHHLAIVTTDASGVTRAQDAALQPVVIVVPQAMQLQQPQVRDVKNPNAVAVPMQVPMQARTVGSTSGVRGGVVNPNSILEQERSGRRQ
ncbi:hypothetical protein HDU97_003816 [Phlyctochytrium planicorne]|nr:hypothetical protein HDU97_003816 [Phlyctochytrium planicorne]